jgi:Zn-dependent protease with chaperone function
MASFGELLRTWFTPENLDATLGYLIAIVCGIFILTELYTIITQKNEPDLVMLLLAGVFGGVVQGVTQDPLLAILVGLCWLMIYSVWTIRESPVWRELMLASLISYIVVLIGRTIQRIMEMWVAYRGYNIETYTRWGLTGQQFFGISWNIFIYIFFILCIIFFGRRFFLVSRLTSPQVIYLLLFALSYVVLYQFSGDKGIPTFYYGGLDQAVADRLLFGSFGTYEIMILTNFVLYLISGPLLHLMFGVKKVKDKRVLGLVEEVRHKLGIKSKIRVGKVKAPILNAFAFGAFFDKRIAFMSRELEDFTDDDIRGIAGHELVHSQKVHTLWLLLISIVSFAITKALALPATTLDYIFDPNVGFEFLWYYLYNIALLGFSYIFVRFLEGRADKLTMNAGYGKALAKSLVKLDGFYQGIASEMGLSVYLLTDKEQTKSEKLRFLGDAGRNMYRNYVKPNIAENLINLIASHPKSAYRVVALTDQEKLRPFKAALLPIFLVIPILRRPFLKDLHEARHKASELISETFETKYTLKGIKQYDNLSHISYQHNFLLNKDIIAISKMNRKEIIQGTITKIEVSKQITSPLLLKLKTSEGSKVIPTSDYKIFEIALDQKQIFKNGKIGIITEINTEEKFSFKAKFNDNGVEEEKELKVPGIPVTYFESIVGKDILLLQKGVTRLAHLEKMDLDENSFAKSKLTITVGNQTKVINGEKFVISFKPFDVHIKKGKEKEQRSLIESLKGKPVSLQTKDDLDTLVKGKVTEVTEEIIKVETLDEKKEIIIKRLEFLYLYEDSIKLIYKPSISFIEKFFMRMQNRTELAYIVP